MYVLYAPPLFADALSTPCMGLVPRPLAPADVALSLNTSGLRESVCVWRGGENVYIERERASAERARGNREITNPTQTPCRWRAWQRCQTQQTRLAIKRA